MMENHSPAYYRARLGTFLHFLKNELPGNAQWDTGKKNSPLELLKQGYVHPGLKERFEEYIDKYLAMGTINNTLLTFNELCSFNTWFALHPEKVAGTETVTTSINFPITIKGTREDIENALQKGLQGDKLKRLRLAQAKAAAKLKILLLLKLHP